MTIRKYYLMLTFWGDRFREYFYSLLLPTLLAPNNIPVLKSRPGSKLIISTTVDDWTALINRPLMRLAAEYVELQPIFISHPDENMAVQLHMSEGHRLAARQAYTDGAIAGFLAPDLLCSDGLIKTAVEAIESGKKAVVAPALRFNMEEALKRVTAAGFLKPGQPAALSPKLMGSVAANSLHPEILRYDFEGPQFDIYPIWSFWRVPNRDGLVIYTVSWALVLGDYTAIPRYEDEFLKQSTIDGSYFYRNFGHFSLRDDVALLSDSSQGTLLSLTPEHAIEFHSSGRINNALFGYFGLGVINRLFKISTFHHGPDLDPWRRRLHSVPIILHGDDLDSAYTRVVARTKSLMDAAICCEDYSQFSSNMTAHFGRRRAKFLLIHYRVLLTAVTVGRVFYYYYLVVRGVARGELDLEHVLRRGLHVLTFGLVCCPANPQTNRGGSPPGYFWSRNKKFRLILNPKRLLSTLVAVIRGR